MNWSRGSILGHGSSATVSLAASPQCGEAFFAVKSSELSCSGLLQREQRILSSLSSPYIVSYKGCDITRENNKVLYNLFMEYMPLGTLSQATHRQGGRLDDPMIAYYIRQVLQGLEYLHSNGLVHCDIKGANILIGEYGAKIADFGCAKRAAAAAAAPIRGTPMFMSPEVARGEEQGYPCDIWALGCTVIEVASGLSPWPNEGDPVSILYRIAYSGEVPEIPGFLSEEAKDFLGKCLRRNPKERWTASQLLKHPFLGELNSNSKQIHESNSSSPTSILEQGFWSSMEESESESNLVHSHTSFENSPAVRIRQLAVHSGEPNWIEDESWITTIGNEGSVIEASTSNNLEESEKSNVSSRISYCFWDDYQGRDVSIVTSSIIFERGIDKLPLHPVSNFL